VIQRKNSSGEIEECLDKDLRKGDQFRFMDGVGKDVWRVATSDAFFGPGLIDFDCDDWGVGSCVVGDED